MFNIEEETPLTEDGVWVDYGGASFKIRHITSLEFQRALAKRQQPFRKKIENGTLDPAQTRELLCKAMSEALIVDAKNLTDNSQQPLAYAPELIFRALIKNIEFRDFVSEYSQNLDNYRKIEKEELGKSS